MTAKTGSTTAERAITQFDAVVRDAKAGQVMPPNTLVVMMDARDDEATRELGIALGLEAVRAGQSVLFRFEPAESDTSD